MRANEFLTEKWSAKYKRSINCSHPRGFSQRAHCAGKKKHNESMMTMEATCPDCGMCQTHGSVMEIKKGEKDSNGYTRCWPGKHAEGTKTGKNGGQVRNCEPNESQGVAEGSEQINEYRDRLLQYVKSLLPTWPDYVLKDWLVPNKGDFSNLPTDALKNGVMEKVQGAGLTPNSKWQLVPDMKFTMDMFDPMTKQRLIGRAGGSSDLGMGIPKDKERHATQAALAQQQGGVRKEPVLLIKSANGYELLEGWHRTIQHFHKFPDGYTGPAYIAVAQGQQGVDEEVTRQMSQGGLRASYQAKYNQPMMEDYLDEARS